MSERPQLEETIEAAEPAESTRQVIATGRVVAPTPVDAASKVPEQLGRYQLRARLGTGGQGWVYEAFDPEPGRRVALKLLRTDRGRAAAAAEHRLKREFRAAADLNHRNVAKLYELGHDAGRAYCTMELIEGSDLVDHLQRVLHSDAESEEVVRALGELVLGVSALHATGLVHRDIKSANVMVEHASGRVVLLDFGLAQSRSEVREGELAGTPGYLAPELLTGAAPSWASDWYAVGVVMYQSLCGPKARAEPQEPGASTLVWPAQIKSRFPLLCQLVQRLLAANPVERPTGSEIVAELSLSAGAIAHAGLQPFRLPEGAELIGREAELASLMRAFEVTRSGRAAMVLIRGESGIGKSSLLEAFLARAAEQSASVLRGICHERELIPFRAIDDLVCRLAERIVDRSTLGAYAPALCRAFPVFRDRFPGMNEELAEELNDPLKPLTEGLSILLRQAAASGPLVLAVEDLQWGDRDSARLLAALLSGAPLSLLLIATLRDGEQGAGFISAFDEALPSQHALSRFDLELGPLTPEATLSLLSRLRPDAPELATLAVASRGVPFVLEELTRAHELTRAEQLEEQPIEGLLARRIARDCPPEAREFIELLAVAGRPLEQGRLLSFAGLEGDAHALLSTLRNQRLIRTEGPRAYDSVDVYHHRIRSAVLATMGTEREATHHLRFAEGLSRDASADPAQVAHHYFRSPRSEAGVPYAERAALLAEQAFAFEQSADLYRQVLHYGAELQLDRLALLRRLSRVLELAGRAADAAHEYLNVAALAQAQAADRARCAAAENFLASGHIAEGSEALEPLFRARGLTFPRSVGGAMLALLPLAGHLWFGRHVERWLSPEQLGAGQGEARAQRGASLARMSDSPQSDDGFRLDLYWAAAKGLAAVDPVRAGYFLCAGLKTAKTMHSGFAVARFGALFSAAVLSPAGGGLARWGRALLSLAERVAQAREDVYLDALVKVALGQWHLQRGDYRGCRDSTEAGRALFAQHCVGVEWETNIACMGFWRALEELGEFARAGADVQEAIAQAERRGDRYGAVTALLYRGVLRLVGDDLEGAEQDASVVMDTWTGHRQLHVQTAYACRVRAMCALARGDALAAWRELDAIWPRLVRSGMLRSPLVHIDFHGLRLRCALALYASGEGPAQMRRLCQRESQRLQKHPRADARAVGLLAAAGLAHQQRGARVEHMLEQASAAFAEAGQPIHAELCTLLRHDLMAAGQAAQASEAALKARGVVNPRRWAQVIAPGFLERPPQSSG